MLGHRWNKEEARSTPGITKLRKDIDEYKRKFNYDLDLKLYKDKKIFQLTNIMKKRLEKITKDYPNVVSKASREEELGRETDRKEEGSKSPGRKKPFSPARKKERRDKTKFAR